MSDTASLARLVQEAKATGTLAGLPDRHFIEGRFVPAAAGGQMETFDPGTGRAFASFAAGDEEDVDAAVRAARRALTGAWGAATPAERARILHRVSELITEHADRLAVVESLDSGKRLSESRGDIAGAARTFEYYAGACDTQLGTSIPLGAEYLAYTVNEPVGVTAHIIPWNYPLSTAARGLAPALAAGCTVVAKPAEQTPLSTLMLAQLCCLAGLPDGVCNVVTGTGKSAGHALVRHPGIDHVTFTGSIATGMGVMQSAAQHVTRVVLELGGKSPVVVLADCDFEMAIDNVMGAIFENAGQICSAGSRLVIARSIHARFLDALVKRANAMTLGHGLRDADLGPLNSPDHLARVAAFVDRARARGVQLRVGGSPASDPLTGLGWFYLPTILDSVPSDDEAVQNEIFGPVLCVQVFDEIEEAVALANGTDFGLVAGVFTRELAVAHRLARRIDAGQVFINEYFAGGISVPFGGNKRSGFGREKGLEGMRSYCKIKSVVARL